MYDMRLFYPKTRTIFFACAVVTAMGIVFHLDLLKTCVVPGQSGDRTARLEFDENSPFVFVGGMPRSGTTLMRALLDAHPLVRCGQETHVIPYLLKKVAAWLKLPKEKERLAAGGVTTDVLDTAVRSFILHIIVKHGEAAPVLCNKDPFTLRHAVYLGHLFPHSKFVFLVRDGRAVVHSVMNRGVAIKDFDMKSPRQMLGQWSLKVEEMYSECRKLGPQRCLPVYYEQLVLHPRRWTKRVLHFLQLPWSDSVLHHQDFVDKPGGIRLSRMEFSSDQVIKPINTDALVTWVGKLPPDVVRDADTIAPMLRVLGYDLHSNLTSFSYGHFESQPSNSSLDSSDSEDLWTRRARLMFHSNVL